MNGITPRHLCSDSGEPTMADGEPCTMENAITVLRTTLEQTNYTYMKYMRSQTQRGANLGRGTR